MVPFFKTHCLIFEIYDITNDYYAFRTHYDKISKPIVLRDTVWFKEKLNPSAKITNKLSSQDYSDTSKGYKKAEFQDGSLYWRNYLERNINYNIGRKNGAPKGVYNVIIEFVIDENGKVSTAEALTNFGFGMEEEAIRAIKNSPNWVPATHKGENVPAFFKQPVTFIVN